ncbi:MAG: hypothetical protein D3923_17780 [Candidatus Electrothrix sp. AR3]|nr:hypothetical protein [Candidatus Electrothrix sp. AR3]
MPLSRQVFFLILCSTLLFPHYSFAVLPDIVKEIEPRMHTKPFKKARAFIEKRQAQADLLAAEAETLLQQSVQPPVQEAVSNAVEIFQGIASQSQRLISEWKNSADTYIKPPRIGRPPYTIDVFNEIRTFQKEVEQHVGQHERNVGDIKRQLASLKNIIEATILLDDPIVMPCKFGIVCALGILFE